MKFFNHEGHEAAGGSVGITITKTIMFRKEPA